MADEPQQRREPRLERGLAAASGSAVTRKTMDRHSLPERPERKHPVTGGGLESPSYPDASGYGRWCEGRGLEPPAYPIRLVFNR